MKNAHRFPFVSRRRATMPRIHRRSRELGIALAICIILLGLLLAFTALAATVINSEARITGAEYRNTRTFNAGLASLEKMTNDFNALYSVNRNPTQTDIASLTASVPAIEEGAGPLYDYKQYVRELAGTRQLVTVRDPPYNDLTARERVYRLQAVATDKTTQQQVRVIRDVANYQIPIFQFAVFAFENLDFSPGPPMFFGGRTHSNRSIFMVRTNGGSSDGPATFYGQVTAVGEISNGMFSNGVTGDTSRRQQIWTGTGATVVGLEPSVTNGQGPDNPGVSTQYDFNVADDPLVPGNGTQVGTFGPTGRVVPRAPRLTLPTENQGFQAVEILRRARATDNAVLESSRLFNGKFDRYSTIRILLDDDFDEFPITTDGSPRAYDLNALSDPNDPAFGTFWVALNQNVRVFNALMGADNPDAAVGTLKAGSGAALGNFSVLPPQTNLVNAQPMFQTNADGSVNNNLRKRSYIKIELVNNNNPPNPPTRIDITRHILNLGITDGPIPLPNFNPASAFSPFNNLADLTGGTGGAIHPQTTYAAAYPLNDGNSINRLTNTATDVPENFMPFLDNSATPVRIGQFSGTFGNAPVKPISFRNVPVINTVAGTFRNTSMIANQFAYEPNAILRLQRTYFPYSPTNTVDMTCADPPAVSDEGVAVLSPINGRVDNANVSTNAAGAYPARHKSLLAKPYFRFTDDFMNDTYVKGNYNNVGGYFEMRNPLHTVDAVSVGGAGGTYANFQYIFNGDANATATPTDKRGERFMRAITARVPTITGFSGTSVTFGGATVTMPNSGTFNHTVHVSAATPESYDLQTFFVQGENNVGTGAWTQGGQQLFNLLRQYVFKPGIPGFYSLAWGDPATGALTSGQNNIVGDRRIDLDVTWYRSGAPTDLPAPRAFRTPTGTELPNGASAYPIGSAPYNAGTEGVVDLQELTPFANTANATKLLQYLFMPNTYDAAGINGLTPSDFPFLIPNSVYNPATPNDPNLLLNWLKSAEIGTPGRASDPSLPTFPASVNGVPEIPKENLVFDWNGDGVITPPKRPFQNTGTLGGNAIGYSVESNVCSLVPSSLNVLHDLAANPASVNQALVDATTSVPIEIRFIEADPGAFGVPLDANLGPLSTSIGQGPGGSFNLVQPDPGFTLTASGGQFQNGFNSFAITVPFNTFGTQFTVPNTAAFPAAHRNKIINLREGVRVIFQHPLATRQGGVAQAIERNIGRRLGLTDSHFAYPGHVYMSFTPNAANPGGVPANNTLMPRLRVVTDLAFPINIYDQREGRHINRRYGFQNIATAPDYHSETIGAGPQAIVNGAWPDRPSTAQVADNVNLLSNWSNFAPMPSPIEYDRGGMMSIVELDLGNLKKLFRGDFNSYLGVIGGGFTSGQPAPNPVGDTTPWGGNGIIDISDNGFVVYISDRRGDRNNNGGLDFNDVYGHNDFLDRLDDTVGQVMTGPQTGRPGDSVLRRDVDVETQPYNIALEPGRGNLVPANQSNLIARLNNPVETGEYPHGSVPANDGYEYFCGNIDRTTRRLDAAGNPMAAYETLLPGTTSATTGTFAGLDGDGTDSATGAVNWRIVDSGKTGRIRAFRRGVRLVNAIDIPRWYLNQDGPVPRRFTGMSLVTENPIYIHGNLNSIGVRVQPSDGPLPDPDSNIPVGGPTQTRSFLQTGNVNNGRTPGDWMSNAMFPDDALLHGPMGILADAITIQSRNWQDGRLFISPYGARSFDHTFLHRVPIETTVKAAWFAGQPRSGIQTTSQNHITVNTDWTGAVLAGASANSNGGVHNYPRFCEIWPNGFPAGNGGTQTRFNYNGSFVWQFYSQQGNGPFLFTGPGSGFAADGPGYSELYQAPTRNWNFDQGFRKLGGLPPATPAVGFYKIRGFRQVFLEDNPN